MSALVSVIVPVYNVEGFIQKCMQSLLDQTYENFEAIIVNDGSPDNSIEVAKSIVGDDPRFVFLEKENGGQGAARNLGLDHAKGNYISFLDSDDYYDSEYLSIMLDKVIRDGADVCVCNVRNVNVSGGQISVRKNNVSLYYKNKDYFMAQGYISNYMWDKLFEINCFKDLRFNENIRTYEDVHLLFRVLYEKKLTSTNKFLYNYVQRSGSTVNSLPKTYIEDRYSTYIEVKKFHKEKLVSNELSKFTITDFFLNNFIFFCSVNIVKHSKNYSTDIDKLLSKDKGGLFNLKNIISSSSLSKNTKASLFLLRTNPNLYRAFVKSWLKVRNIREIL